MSQVRSRSARQLPHYPHESTMQPACNVISEELGRLLADRQHATYDLVARHLRKVWRAPATVG